MHTISISDLTGGFFYPFMRKPDFQRETNEWDESKVLSFIESFVDGDLIPAVILWRSNSGLYFVIDGSHRLSALIAWINDDYGDGDISQKYFSNDIPEEQKAIAQQTRQLVNKNIGAFKDVMQSPTNIEADSIMIRRASNLGAYSLQVQWVDGDSKKAENSFFKINQQGEPLNKTEIKLLKARKKPNCIASRAIIRAGKGHKYWSEYSAEKQVEIQNLAKEIHEIIFNPPLKTPVKTLDLPIGGKILSAQTLPLILELINIVNKVPKDFRNNLDDDTNGENVVRYLKNVRKVVWRINSIHPSSLGLHPMVYFYSQEGKHKPASFYSIIAFVIELSDKNRFNDFIAVREKFETTIIEYGYVIQQISRKYRSAVNSIKPLKEFYFLLIEKLLSGLSVKESIEAISNIDDYKYLSLKNELTEDGYKNFTTEKKSAVFITEALKTAVKCKICGGYIHRNSITIDHIERKEDGGLGTIENGQLAHPYCNSTVKN